MSVAPVSGSAVCRFIPVPVLLLLYLDVVRTHGLAGISLSLSHS